MSVTQCGDAIATFDLTQFDSVSVAVVTAVAEETGKNLLNLEPLYNVIDPTSLNTVFAASSPQAIPAGCVAFEYEDYWVVVNANGRGHLYDPSDQPSTC